MVTDVGLRAILSVDVDEQEVEKESENLRDVINDKVGTITPDVDLTTVREGVGRSAGQIAGRKLPGRLGTLAGGVLGETLAGTRGDGSGGGGEGPEDDESGESLVDLAIERNEHLDDISEYLDEDSLSSGDGQQEDGLLGGISGFLSSLKGLLASSAVISMVSATAAAVLAGLVGGQSIVEKFDLDEKAFEKGQDVGGDLANPELASGLGEMVIRGSGVAGTLGLASRGMAQNGLSGAYSQTFGEKAQNRQKRTGQELLKMMGWDGGDGGDGGAGEGEKPAWFNSNPKWMNEELPEWMDSKPPWWEEGPGEGEGEGEGEGKGDGEGVDPKETDETFTMFGFEAERPQETVDPETAEERTKRKVQKYKSNRQQTSGNNAQQNSNPTQVQVNPNITVDISDMDEIQRAMKEDVGAQLRRELLREIEQKTNGGSIRR